MIYVFIMGELKRNKLPFCFGNSLWSLRCLGVLLFGGNKQNKRNSFLERVWGLYDQQWGPLLRVWLHHWNPWIWVVAIFQFHSLDQEIEDSFLTGLPAGRNELYWLFPRQWSEFPAIPAELSATGALQWNVRMLMQALLWLRAMGMPSPGKQPGHGSASRVCLQIWKHWPSLSPFGPAKCRSTQ